MTYNKKEYQKLIKDLYKNKDEQYKQFHSKLLKDNSIELIGIRTPELKKIAKEISKNDYKSFIRQKKRDFISLISIIINLIIFSYFLNNLTRFFLGSIIFVFLSMLKVNVFLFDLYSSPSIHQDTLGLSKNSISKLLVW